MKYVVEHLDPQVFDWSLLEYKHISKLVGKDNLIFTNVKKEKKKIELLGEIQKESITDRSLQKKIHFNPKKAIILDPGAEKTLTIQDCKKSDFLVLGGILGNYPPEKRTKKWLSDKLKCEYRNLGKNQMSTDTAVYVAKKIAGGKKLEDLRFAYMLEVQAEDGLSMELPYQYVIEKGQPVLAPGFIEFISRWKGF